MLHQYEYPQPHPTIRRPRTHPPPPQSKVRGSTSGRTRRKEGKRGTPSSVSSPYWYVMTLPTAGGRSRCSSLKPVPTLKAVPLRIRHCSAPIRPRCLPLPASCPTTSASSSWRDFTLITSAVRPDRCGALGCRSIKPSPPARSTSERASWMCWRPRHASCSCTVTAPPPPAAWALSAARAASRRSPMPPAACGASKTMNLTAAHVGGLSWRRVTAISS
mmetsp:Transcript_41280/g.113558  ORF Transcript_41280/g.113558 Transcript_41280/m.113558 type:complete len:218 (+) Transcript_41280:79-732(+)